jgi:pyridoxine 5-phosphate synthase
MTKLSVNINKIATLRNARGGNVPDPVQCAVDIEKFGASGITVHPRPDGRHIRTEDVYNLKKAIRTDFNIEGYPSTDFLNLIADIRPEQVTLVPDPPDVLTSNNGWDCIKFGDYLREIIEELHRYSPCVSVFLNPDPTQAKAAAKTGADRIELYTEAYAAAYLLNRESAIDPYKVTAEACRAEGLGINAGHDLNLSNLGYLVKTIPFINEVSIGHALISDALYYGLENTIQMYLNQLDID